jgi:hypothetical protein
MSGTVPNGNAIKDVVTGLASASLKSRNPRQHTPRHIRTAGRVRAAAVQEYSEAGKLPPAQAGKNSPGIQHVAPITTSGSLSFQGTCDKTKSLTSKFRTRTDHTETKSPARNNYSIFPYCKFSAPASSAPRREGNGMLKTQTTWKRTLPPETATASSLTADLGPCVLSSPSRRKGHGSRSRKK